MVKYNLHAHYNSLFSNKRIEINDEKKENL